MLLVDDISAGYHQQLLKNHHKDCYCKKLLAKLTLSADSFIKNFNKLSSDLIFFNNLVFVPHCSKVKLDIVWSCYNSPTFEHQKQAKTLKLVS